MGLTHVIIGEMNETAVWLIGIAIQIRSGKSESCAGGSRTVERMRMSHRVMDDMTIGAILLELLLRPLFGLRRLVDSWALVLQ